MWRRRRTSLVVTQLCLPFVWSVPSAALVYQDGTAGESSNTLSSLFYSELSAPHGHLATLGPNCTLAERQTRRRSSRPFCQHGRRQLTKHEWPLPHPPAIPEPRCPTPVSMTLLAPLHSQTLSSHQPSTFFDHIHGKTILNCHVSHNRFPACCASWSTAEDARKTSLKKVLAGWFSWG